MIGENLPENGQYPFVREHHLPSWFDPVGFRHCSSEIQAKFLLHQPLPRVKLEDLREWHSILVRELFLQVIVLDGADGNAFGRDARLRRAILQVRQSHCVFDLLDSREMQYITMEV